MKVIYNPVTKRFSAEKSIEHKKFSYSSESHSDESPKRYKELDAFNNLIDNLTKGSELDLYKACIFIEDGSLKSDVSKICHQMALQAAAEGMDLHRLVERIQQAYRMPYWVDWLKGKLEDHGLAEGSSYDPMRVLQDYVRKVGKQVNFNTNIANSKRVVKDYEAREIFAQDYPNDYLSKEYLDYEREGNPKEEWSE